MVYIYVHYIKKSWRIQCSCVCVREKKKLGLKLIWDIRYRSVLVYRVEILLASDHRENHGQSLCHPQLHHDPCIRRERLHSVLYKWLIRCEMEEIKKWKWRWIYICIWSYVPKYIFIFIFYYIETYDWLICEAPVQDYAFFLSWWWINAEIGKTNFSCRQYFTH